MMTVAQCAGLQQQMETPRGCAAMLLEAPAPGPGPQPACPGSAEPRGWRCSHLKQPYVLEVPAYEVTAVSAAEGQCGLVGVTNVLCGDVVMEAVTYEAITHGVCKPLCRELAPELCAVPLSVYAPGIAPLPSPYGAAPRAPCFESRAPFHPEKHGRLQKFVWAPIPLCVLPYPWSGHLACCTTAGQIEGFSGE